MSRRNRKKKESLDREKKCFLCELYYKELEKEEKIRKKRQRRFIRIFWKRKIFLFWDLFWDLFDNGFVFIMFLFLVKQYI